MLVEIGLIIQIENLNRRLNDWNKIEKNLSGVKKIKSYWNKLKKN